ncbi:hypothetical protein [Streptomyces sp. NPDC089799]|uniref:hypothetical protein n=1 Tax=Streptomyces sp. NPDC089799 TaxID=3155066 RepID=UPI0034401DFB
MSTSLPRRWAPVLCWSGLVAGILLAAEYARRRPAALGAGAEQRLQLAGDRAGACAAIGEDCARARADLFREALELDWTLFIPAYGLVLLAVFGFGRLYLHRPVARRASLRALGLTLAAVAADVAENAFLYAALDRLATAPDPYLRFAAYCALVKWALIGPLAATAVWVAATLAARGVTGRARVYVDPRPAFRQRMGTAARRLLRRPPGEGDLLRAPLVTTAYDLAGEAAGHVPGGGGHEDGGDDRPGADPAAAPAPAPAWLPDLIEPPMAPPASTPLADWAGLPTKGPAPGDSAIARWRTRALVLPARKPAATGICVSGGGIRSASVTLGALQALREQGVLDRAEYLVSVSGGGYAAGAFQLAVTPRPARLRDTDRSPRGLAGPDDAFAPGSPEEDHVRRHAKYLMDTPRETVVALGTVLRGVLVSLGLLILTFLVAGELVAGFYAAVPVADLPGFRRAFEAGAGLGDFPLYPHVWPPVLALVCAAALVSLGGTLYRTYRGAARPAWLRSTLRAVLWTAVAVLALAVAVPWVVWFYTWLSVGRQVVPDDIRGVSALGALTAGLTWVGGLFAARFTRTRQVRNDGDRPGPFSAGRVKTITTRIGNGWTLRLVTWLVLLVLGFVLLFFLSWAAVWSGDWPPGWQVGLPAALVVLALVLDQTTFSLHPFYRQRLAGAFAVRRTVLEDGSIGSLPYDYNGEPTSLSTHAERVRPFPKVIFAASAALSGRNRTPPGRPAVPITFASDYVGGPDIGWVRTTTLEHTAHPLIRADVTVQSAMAVSGAAFASAMGSQSTAVERLLALSNLRLGTWLPNPAYLAAVARKEDARWTMPRLPRVRRLRYQLQELVGRHPDTSPMLLCTDGGHVDNLGLVELLRLRCRTVYVVDASGDTPPLATTLAQAVTLAYEDLGVRITFAEGEALKLVPGSAEPLAPADPLAALNARLSADCVVTGTIEYPEDIEFEPGKPAGRTGRIVVAKAGLTPDMAYELLSYSLRERSFPRVSTFDQSFDHAQFDAYRALGHHLGTRAAEVGRDAEPPGTDGDPPTASGPGGDGPAGDGPGGDGPAGPAAAAPGPGAR